MTGAKKLIDEILNRNWPQQRIEIGSLRIQFQCFGANFADRWPRWTGALLIKVHLHSKLFWVALKWHLKGGSRLIEVAATAGLTVQGLFLADFIAIIRLYSQCQKVSFFPNFRRKIPNFKS